MEKHLYHPEDLVLMNRGKEAIHSLSTLARVFASGVPSKNLSLSEKYDGAPAIVFGEDKDGFFIGTKSALAKKNPRRYRRAAEIVADGDIPETLRAVLAEAFMPLWDLWKNGLLEKKILSADVLWARDSRPIEEMTMMPETCLRGYFARPNIVAYAVPSWIASNRNLTLGLVLHPSPEALGIIGRNGRGVFLGDPRIKHGSFLTSDEYRHIRLRLASATRILNSPRIATFLRRIEKDVLLRERLLVIENHLVRTELHDLPSSQRVSLEKQFLIRWADSEISKLKTEKGRNAARNKFEKRLQKYDSVRAQRVAEARRIIASVRDELISKLPCNVALEELPSFVEFSTGEKRLVRGEGYVLRVGENTPMKLVNRREFSAVNFSEDVVRGFKRTTDK